MRKATKIHYYTLWRLYPDSKMMGGSMTKKKTVGENASSFCNK